MIAQLLHGCRQLVPWGVPLSGTTSATPIQCYKCHWRPPTLRVQKFFCIVRVGGRRGRRQVSTALMPWATHTLQWRITTGRKVVMPSKSLKFRLNSD